MICGQRLVSPQTSLCPQSVPPTPATAPASPSLRGPISPAPHRATAFVPTTMQVPEEVLEDIAAGAVPSPLHAAVWDAVLTEAGVPGRDTIVAALRDGVPLVLNDIVLPTVHVKNHPLLYYDLPRAVGAVDKEVRLGRYVMWPPSAEHAPPSVSAMGIAPRFDNFATRRRFETQLARCSHQLLAHASDDFGRQRPGTGPGLDSVAGLAEQVKWRVIHDLTYPEGRNVNSFVESPYFELPTAVAFARRLHRNSYIWKGDVDSAFRLVPVRQRDWPALAFHIDGNFYVDTRLPFGHRLSPYYFVNFVGRPILYVCLRRGASLLGSLSSYVDDFFGGCDTYDDALDQLELWLQVCQGPWRARVENQDVSPLARYENPGLHY